MFGWLRRPKREKKPCRYDIPETWAEQKAAGLVAAREDRVDDALLHFLRAANQNHVEHVGGKSDTEIDMAILEMGRRHQAPGRPVKAPGDRIRIAHVNPYWMDQGGHSSVVLGALAFHDHNRFEVHGYSLELHDSRELGPRALALAAGFGAAYHSMGSAATYEEKADALFHRFHEDGIDVAVFYPAPNDGISPYVAARRPPCMTVMYDTNNIGFNLGPFLFDHHLDTTEPVLEECRAGAAGQPAEFHHFHYFPQYFSSRSTDAEALDRSELDVQQDATVSITVGQLFKFQHGGNPVYFDTLERLMARAPNHCHLIVCPSPDDALPTMLRERYGDRVRHLSPRFDLARVLRACDIYINSFPVGGGCSLQEAIAAGLPVVSLSDRRNDESRVITEEIGDRRLVVDTPEEMVDLMVRLIEDPDMRRESGRINRQHFDTTLHASAVMARLEELLLRLHSAATAGATA